MATAASSFRDAWQSVLQAVFPSQCVCCGDVLVRGERYVCLTCLGNLRHTHFSAINDNPVERRLATRIPIVYATAMLHFQRGNTVQSLVHSMKFNGSAELCIHMGRQLGLELLRSARFDDVDLLVPVPLHWTRRLTRGYNQSELLCRGISQTFGRQVNTTALKRRRYTRKQSRRHASDRERNVSGAFGLRHPDQLSGHHILLVDDVMTTGATLASCAQALSSVPDLSISVATLSVAGD